MLPGIPPAGFPSLPELQDKKIVALTIINKLENNCRYTLCIAALLNGFEFYEFGK